MRVCELSCWIICKMGWNLSFLWYWSDRGTRWKGLHRSTMPPCADKASEWGLRILSFILQEAARWYLPSGHLQLQRNITANRYMLIMLTLYQTRRIPAKLHRSPMQWNADPPRRWNLPRLPTTDCAWPKRKNLHLRCGSSVCASCDYSCCSGAVFPRDLHNVLMRLLWMPIQKGIVLKRTRCCSILILKQTAYRLWIRTSFHRCY